MRLQRVRLQNFRQHVDSTIEFRSGLTGIIGPNGAGKSTILEAIAWAVYGAPAARGTNDTIRFSRAAPRARVLVELTFELANQEYRVVRTLNSAEVFSDNGLAPIAAGVGAATAYLQSKLGMTRQEFFNTYFTGQKELQFLAQMGPSDRARFLAQVLGYERLRKAQDIARRRRNELRAEIDGLKAGLPDPATLRDERQAVEQRLKQAAKDAGRAEKAQEKAAAELTKLAPKLLNLQEARERARELDASLRTAELELKNAEREVERAKAELQKIEAAEKELAALKPELDQLPVVSAECDRLDELARLHERRAALSERQAELQKEQQSLRDRLAQIASVPDVLRQTTEELEGARAALADTERTAEAELTAWNRDAQDVKTQLRINLTTQTELEQQIKRLKATGKHGACPVCTRKLEDEFETVLSHLEEELLRLRQDARWLKQREKQLGKRPTSLVEAEEKLTKLRQTIVKKSERVAHCEQVAGELWEKTTLLQKKEVQLNEINGELGAMPAEYDAERHASSKKRLSELRSVAQRAGVFVHQVEGKDARTRELDVATEAVARTQLQMQTLTRTRAALKFDEDEFAQTGARHHQLTQELQAAKIATAEAAQILKSAQEALTTLKRAEAVFEEKQQRLLTLEAELRHHGEMDTALTHLRGELNMRVRPELAELASSFLSDITDGRYNALDIDESFNVLVLEDGEEKPVISGGEEDIANLVLRIAISQMIAERAGQHLSTLFLDEVFGSLDLERRDNVIQLLQKLQDRFEQVVLITHVETVREGLDHVIRLEYDERSGASVVKEDVSANGVLVTV